MPIDVKYIVLHTSDSRARNVDATTIDQWHRGRGWAKIGYHYVVLDDRRDDWWRDGEIQPGRAAGKMGAHCLGLNDQSIGICVVGNGNKRRWTPRQLQSVVWLCAKLCRRYSVDPSHVIGHREINGLAMRGIVDSKFRTDKTCPGTMVDMPTIRDHVAMVLSRGVC